MHPYEQKVILNWVLNVLNEIQPSARAASFLRDWMREHKGLYDLTLPSGADDDNPFESMARGGPGSSAFVIDLAALAQADADARDAAEEKASASADEEDGEGDSDDGASSKSKSAKKKAKKKAASRKKSSPAADADNTTEADIASDEDEDLGDDDSGDADKPETPKLSPAEKIAQLVPIIKARIKDLKQPGHSGNEKKLRILSELTGMTKGERDILGLIVRYKLFPSVEDFVDGISLLRGGRRLLRGEPALIGLITKMSARGVADLIKPDAHLQTSGLISIGGEGEIDTLNRMTLGLFSAANDEDSILRVLIGPLLYRNLPWARFAHVDDREMALELIRNALSKGEKGVHLFLYGPSGTGKTEFAASLASELSAQLFALGEADDWGNQPAPDERLGALQTAYSVLKRRKNTLLMVDEVEELFFEDNTGTEFRGRLRGSPVFFHKLLADSPVPTIWTVRNIAALEPIFIRHASLALEMSMPAPAKRDEIWRHHLKAQGIDLRDEQINVLARRYEVTPGQIASIARSAKLMHVGAKGSNKAKQDAVMDLLERSALSLTQAMRAGSPAPVGKLTHGKFNEKIVNADHDLEKLTGRLSGAMRHKPFSMLLYGPAGCGKSEYVRHLAETLGLELLQKRASDVLSKWVGESEQQIALAFQEARRRNAFLVFDEADSLLGSRKQAGHTWEVSQVNEMLTWMESHPLPFAATTNLMSWLDEAALRRFTFKVGFKHLEDEQLELAYTHFFHREAPERVRSISELTPGDFAVAARKAEILDVLNDDEELIKLLTEESEVKPDQRNIIGFKRRDGRRKRTTAQAQEYRGDAE